MTECEGSDSENVITMVDVLEEEKELEDNAFAVLGASDEKNCTYSLGYVPRQALYACNTCRKNDSEPAGICLACSYACHEGHELYELYTKRNFRCDCGNSKMNLNTCALYPEKSSLNPGNKYNHNFFGQYCTCERPFPDPENDDEMFQCIVCEDWFHGLHLDSELPENNDFAEMICGQCMAKLNFLWYYHQDVSKTKDDNSDNEGDLKDDIKNGDKGGNKDEERDEGEDEDDARPRLDNDDAKEDVDNKSCDESLIDSGVENSCDSMFSVSAECKLRRLTSAYDISNLKGATFWDENWRSTLCKCAECIRNYSMLGCKFICDQEDTVQHYEDLAKDKSVQISQYERGLTAINSMDRVKRVEAIYECNFMAEELKDYLKKFVDNKKIVRTEDIQEFFEGLKARKRRKIEIPYSCR